MIEIIVRNDPPGERKLLFQCSNCESIVIADYEDIEDDGPLLNFRCPVCQKLYQTPSGAGKDFFIDTYFKRVTKRYIESLKKMHLDNL